MIDSSGTSTSVSPSNGGHAAPCPSWCVDTGRCLGDHFGKESGTVATGGLPPVVDGPEAPTYNTAAIRAQYPESDGLPPGVALFGNYRNRDFQVDLTILEARKLHSALAAAIAEAESA